MAFRARFTFWSSIEGTVPRVLVMEIVPIMLILALTAALTIRAGPALDFTDAAVHSIANPSIYSEAVERATPQRSWQDKTLQGSGE